MLENGSVIAPKGPCFGERHVQSLLIFFGIAVSMSMRVNLSVAIVAMTDRNSSKFVEYTPTETSLILSSFLWGYVITQVPGGHFAKKFGGRILLLVNIFFTSIMTIITPFCAMSGDWRLPFAVRVLQGLSQGSLFPSTHTLLAKWSPAEERGLLGTFVYAGTQFGTVVMFAGSGLIAASPLGWQGVFYIPGCMGLLWLVAWYIWGSSSPSEHKTITEDEKLYILNSLANGEKLKTAADTKQHHPPTPWIAIFKSKPFLALMMAHTAYCWCFWTMLTQIPSYLKNILGFDIKSNALLTSLPYLAMFILNFVFSAMASFIDKRKWLTLTGNRKLFNTFSAWIPAIALVSLGYLDADHSKLAVFLLVIAVGFAAAVHVGFMVNHIDLSPNFAGILMGITNMVSHVISILAPLIVGFIVKDKTSPFQWRMIFFIAAGAAFVGNSIFLLFGSAKVQPFNETDEAAVSEEMKPMNTDSSKA